MSKLCDPARPYRSLGVTFHSFQLHCLLVVTLINESCRLHRPLTHVTHPDTLTYLTYDPLSVSLCMRARRPTCTRFCL